MHINSVRYASTMKNTLSISLLFVVLVTAAFAGDNKPAVADRDALVRELQRTEAKFLKSVEGLSEAQWHFKAAENRWSIAQCAEHIAAAEPLLRPMIEAAMGKELTPEMLAEAR